MAATKVWTLDEMHSLPDDGNKYELVHGELLVTPAPAPRHESAIARLGRVLDRYAEEQGLGFAYRARSVIQYEGSETEPDLMVRQEIDRDTPWDQAPVPILVVEVLSPSSRKADRFTKREYYREVGVTTYWIVDPDAKCVAVIEAGRDDAVVRSRFEWHPRGAHVPLVVDVAALFA